MTDERTATHDVLFALAQELREAAQNSDHQAGAISEPSHMISPYRDRADTYRDAARRLERTMRTLTKGEGNRKPFDIEKAAMAAQPSVEELADRMVNLAEGHNGHLFVGDGRSERCRTCQLSESEGRHKLEPKPEDAPWHHLRHGFFQMPGPTGGGPLEDRCSNCGNTEADDIHNEVVGV